MKMSKITSAIQAPAALLRRERAIYLDHDGPHEYVYQRPALAENEILVQSVMTGICSSDVAMINGEFQMLPREMHGHEGLGIVEKVGRLIDDVRPGDYVATRGEPAYADRYNARWDTYVKVPELRPEYILEPVACALNLYESVPFPDRKGMCVIGTGFLAKVIHQAWLRLQLPARYFCVVGNANADYWGELRVSPEDFRALLGLFRSVVELKNSSASEETFCHLRDGGTLIIGHDKPAQRSFPVDRMLWGAYNVSFPSPRSRGFIKRMHQARDMVESKELDLDGMWTHAYNRDTSWREAFAEAQARSAGFQRGYLVWS